MAGREPEAGVLIQVPPHKGPATLTFDLHNLHTYSEEQVRAKRAFTRYTATIGVLTMDNTLISRAVVQSEFRAAADLVDRVGGGAGPGGVKAVAPTALLYLGVLSCAAGLGWTVREHFASLGDAAVLTSLSLVFVGTLYYCFTRAAPYSSAQVAAPTFVFDYVLYFGCLAFASELG